VPLAFTPQWPSRYCTASSLTDARANPNSDAHTLSRCLCRSVCQFASCVLQNAENIDGHIQSLSKYMGRVTLIVNVASQCGYTDENYKGER
jgi:hypothetical protein